jgi:hypothetical protein
MLTIDDIKTFRGIAVVDAQICERDGAQVLRLRLQDGAIIAVDGSHLNVSDETSIGW